MRISDAILPDRGSALMGVSEIHLLRMQNLPPCHTKDTHGRRLGDSNQAWEHRARRSAVDDEAAIPHNPPHQYATGAGISGAC
jgi:hypothetical protein